jgi:phosphoglycolate phosphatase
MYKEKMVIFDLDGTLVDTAPDLINSANFALKNIINNPINIEESRKIIGKGGKYLIEKSLFSRNIKLSDDKINQLTLVFLEYYKNNIYKDSRPFSNMIETLNMLKEFNINIAICTNKSEELTKILLSKMGLLDYFNNIVAGDSLPKMKPDPLPLLTLIKEKNIKKSNAIMVGDSENDIIASKLAGIKVIGVTFGYSETGIEQLHPDYIANNFTDVKEIIKRNFL